MLVCYLLYLEREKLLRMMILLLLLILILR